MELSEYIFALDKGEPAVGKDGIVLPEAMRDKFTGLYEMSEKMGAEHGCALFFDRKTQKFDYSKVASGGKTSMNIPESDHPDNSGNVHAHRSTRSGTREDAFAKQFKYIFIHWNLPKNDCLVM